MKHLLRVLCVMILLTMLPLVSFSEEDSYLETMDIEASIKGSIQYSADIVEIRDAYLKAFNTFNNKITQVWASESAPEKYNKELEKMLEFPDKLVNGTDAVIGMLGLMCYASAGVRNIPYSIDCLDEADNALFEREFTYVPMSTSIESDEFGKLQGIHPALARQYLDEFINDCKKNIYPKLAAITWETGIDPNGDGSTIVNAVKEGIKQRAEKFLTRLDEISSTFDELIQGEKEELRFTVKEEEEAEIVSND